MNLKKLFLLLFLMSICFGGKTLFAADSTSTPNKAKTTQKAKKPGPVKKDIFQTSTKTKSAFPELPTNQSLVSGGAPPVAMQVGILAGLAILPWVVMMLTSYIKIVVVISLLRNALGVQQAPPNQVVNGIALLLTIYIMFPTGLAMYNSAKGYIHENAPSKLISSQSAEYIMGALDRTKEPLRTFLVNNTSQGSLNRFYQMAYRIFPAQFRADLGRTDFIVLIPSYITSQLRDAFAIGVLIYLPFFVIDLVTSNILLAMGMMMLSPLTISLPLKLLLLVMVDGWTILIQGLVLTFR
jgi:type III secretion protein R